MDTIDCQLVNLLQDGIEVSARPFLNAAEQLGISEEVVVSRIGKLREDGYLSRFGPMYDAEKMGGAISLCAMEVPAADMESVTEIVNGLPEVAHNYERDHALNMWFVIATDDVFRLQAVIDKIEAATGIEVYNMPKLEEYYIGLRLDAGAAQ
ncbi:MAG: Lrp/AsnC family transcriptional regulator [Gammaproteobacteria bacterium]|nr:Lrp/AsnC family transcriptional regulator [Gammaproteobacteria bacterium]